MRPLLSSLAHAGARSKCVQPDEVVTQIDVGEQLQRQHLTGTRQEVLSLLGRIQNSPGPWSLDFKDRGGYQLIPHPRFVSELATTLALYGLADQVLINAPENPLWEKFDEQLRWTVSLLSSLTGV